MRSTLTTVSSSMTIDQAVLNIDAAGVCAAQIPEEFLKRRRLLKGIVGEDAEKLFRLRSQTCRTETAGIFLGLLSEDDPPRCHQPGSFSHWFTGVASPSMMDSRMPGTE